MKTKRAFQTNGKAIKKIQVILVLAAALIFLAELAVHRHAYFSIETLMGFHGWLGLIAALLVLLLGRMVLGRALRRPLDYYGEGEDD